LAVALTLLEVGLRILAPRYGYAAASPYAESPSRLWSARPNTCQWRLAPDTGVGHLVIHNSLGLRQHREMTRAKPSGVVRIGVLGDSYTDNLRLPAYASFTEPLDYLLNRAGARVEVLNLGVDGYDADQIYVTFREECDALDLDLVVYALCHNDLRYLDSDRLVHVDASGTVTLVDRPRSRRWTRPLRGLYLTYLAMDVLGRAESGPGSRPTTRAGGPIARDFAAGVASPEAERAVTALLALILDMDRQARGRGRSFHVATLPINGEWRLDLPLRERGISVIPLTDAFAEAFPDRSFLFRSDPHWNAAANRLAAELLFLALAEDVGIERVDRDFASDELDEYYAAFMTGSEQGSSTSEGLAFPDRLAATRATYLELEDGLGWCRPDDPSASRSECPARAVEAR